MPHFAFPRRTAMRFAVAVGVGLVALPAMPAPSVAQSAWVTDRGKVPAGSTPTDDEISLISGIVHRPDVKLRDGTIEFDLAPPAGKFAGIAFHMASTADYEIFYFGTSDDGERWARIQYQPVFQGETNWQLYHGGGYEAAIPASTRGRDLHVRIVISGTRADMYLDGAATPVLRVAQLKRAPIEGGVGVWAIPEESNKPATVRHLRVDPTARVALEPLPLETHPAGQIMAWRLSPRVANDSIDPPLVLPDFVRRDAGTWIDAEPESSGLINLNRQLGNAAGPQTMNVFGGAGWGVAYAKLRVESDRVQVRHLSVAYSDGIGIYVNGRRVYVGHNASDSRYPGQLGVVGNDAEGIDLYLEKGVTEIVLAITDKAFGWGFKARMDSFEGLRVR